MEKKGKKWAVKILILHLFKSFPSSVLSIQCLFVCIRMFKFIYIHVFVSYTLSMPSALEEHMENLLVWLHFLLYIYIYIYTQCDIFLRVFYYREFVHIFVWEIWKVCFLFLRGVIKEFLRNVWFH